MDRIGRGSCVGVNTCARSKGIGTDICTVYLLYTYVVAR